MADAGAPGREPRFPRQQEVTACEYSPVPADDWRMTTGEVVVRTDFRLALDPAAAFDTIVDELFAGAGAPFLLARKSRSQRSSAHPQPPSVAEDADDHAGAAGSPSNRAAFAPRIAFRPASSISSRSRLFSIDGMLPIWCG